MKLNKILNIFALAGLVFAGTSCQEDSILSLDPNGRPEVSNYNINVTVDPETNEFTLSTDNLQGVYPIWRVYANPRDPEAVSARSTAPVVKGVIKNKGDYNVELQIGNRNGISDGVRTATIHIDKDLADPNQFKGFKYDFEYNLWKDATIQFDDMYFANNDWDSSACSAPQYDIATDGIFVHTPPEMGSQQWQGQLKVRTNIPVQADETYDFSVFVYTQIDTKVVVKTMLEGDDNTFFEGMGDQKTVKAGGDVVSFIDKPGFDGTLYIVFDFGGYPDTDFEFSNFVFKMHKYDDGTDLSKFGGDGAGGDADDFGGFDPYSPYNQWKTAKVALASTWFANNDWGELNPQPSVDVSNDGIFLHAPADMGGSQWQGQVHVTTDIPVTADELYDFSCHVYTSGGGKVTVKTQMEGNDDVMFAGMGDQKDVKAGDNVIYFYNQPGFDGTLKIAFDFGGLADQDIEITDIVFKNAKDDDGSEKPVSWDADRNLWATGNVYLDSTWFANNDWGELNPQPSVDVSNDGIFFHAPAEMGGSQWQGQVHVMTDIPVSADNNYDFMCVVNVPADGKVTVKTQMAGNDDVMFEGMGDQKPVTAGKNIIKFTNKPGFDGTFKIAFDFGGFADMDIEVTDIHFQVH